MSTSASVEELLTETLRRAGELAIPDQLHRPFPSDDQVGDMDGARLDRAGVRSVRSWRIAATGIAALVLVAVGLGALLRSSPSVILERTQLSVGQAQQLLCGVPGCAPEVHAGAGLPTRSGAENGGPAYGGYQTTPSTAPLGMWILASNGEFEQVIDRSAGTSPVSRSRSGAVYLSAGGGRYYRFTIPEESPPQVIGHSAHTVTLKGTNGQMYLLNLRTSELTPKQ